MRLFFANKFVRLLLAITVSVWMAGGCLLGCSNTTMAAEISNTVESGESCHAAHHASSPKLKQPEGVSFFAPAPRGMMKDCPLVVNATAVVSKNSTHVPDPGRVSVAVLPSFEKQTQLSDNTLVVPFPPNRGPTHLRCCVFLI